jgi:hypothetical protein
MQLHTLQVVVFGFLFYQQTAVKDAVATLRGHRASPLLMTTKTSKTASSASLHETLIVDQEDE